MATCKKKFPRRGTILYYPSTNVYFPCDCILVYILLYKGTVFDETLYTKCIPWSYTLIHCVAYRYRFGADFAYIFALEKPYFKGSWYKHILLKYNSVLSEWNYVYCSDMEAAMLLLIFFGFISYALSLKKKRHTFQNEKVTKKKTCLGRCFFQISCHTVDGSEIQRPTTWDGHKTW